MNRKQALEATVRLLGPMGHIRVNKKTAPGSRYQVGVMDKDGVLVKENVKSMDDLFEWANKPYPIFHKVAEGRTFAEALQNAEIKTLEMPVGD